MVTIASSEEIPLSSISPNAQLELTAPSKLHSPPRFIAPKVFHAVLKISNISWDISSKDISDLLKIKGIGNHQIHIPIDCITGKTLSDMFVEVSHYGIALALIQAHNRKVLKGRALLMMPSSFNELLRSHFKRVPGEISEEECTGLIEICRNYKSYFSRKCAQRPFKHVISLLRLAPWYSLSACQVDRLFDLVYGCSNALEYFITAPSSSKNTELNLELMQRLANACMSFVPFSEGRKQTIQSILTT